MNWLRRLFASAQESLELIQEAMLVLDRAKVLADAIETAGGEFSHRAHALISDIDDLTEKTQKYRA